MTLLSLQHKNFTRYIIIGVSAFGIMVGCSKKESGAPAAKKPSGPPRVEAQVISPQTFTEDLSLTGSILPNEQVQILSEIGGRITNIRFQEGAAVAKGQILVKIDDSELLAQIKKLERQGVLDADKMRRYQELKKVDGISQEELDAAVAAVDVRNAELEELRAKLAKTEIRAPFSGRVGLRNISVGAVISPQTPITWLADDTGLKLDFSVPERYAQTIKVGSNVNYSVRGQADNADKKATVFAMEPVIDLQTRSIRIRARMPRAIGNVPGMFADVHLRLADIPNALLVPSDAIQQSMNGATVYVLHGNKVNEARLELGGRTATHVRVLSGINPGDTIITSGLLALKNNVQVRAEVK